MAQQEQTPTLTMSKITKFLTKNPTRGIIAFNADTNYNTTNTVNLTFKLNANTDLKKFKFNGAILASGAKKPYLERNNASPSHVVIGIKELSKKEIDSGDYAIKEGEDEKAHEKQIDMYYTRTKNLITIIEAIRSSVEALVKSKSFNLKDKEQYTLYAPVQTSYKNESGKDTAGFFIRLALWPNKADNKYYNIYDAKLGIEKKTFVFATLDNKMLTTVTAQRFITYKSLVKQATLSLGHLYINREKKTINLSWSLSEIHIVPHSIIVPGPPVAAINKELYEDYSDVDSE
jgi:hypothetical protein